jgi:translocation and assembly module TamB
MVEPGQKPSKRSTLRQAVLGALVLLFFVCGAWYLTSNRFREVIRHRLITQIEDATGGQVEIGHLEWNVASLRFGIESLTIHGLEAPADAPLLHIDRIDASLRLVSLLGRQLRFKSLVVDSPSLNLILYPDGRTNQPTPRTRRVGSQQGPLDNLFDIAIRNLVVKNGVLQVNEQKTPFDFRASDVTANLGYQARPEFYAGKVTIGKFETYWKDYRPFSSSAKLDLRLYRTSLEIVSAGITSEGSDLSFEGKLTDFLQPRIQLKYEAKLDLRQIGAVSRVMELQTGTLEMSGDASFDGLRIASAGKLKLSDGAWIHPDVHVSGVSGTAAYNLDQDRLQVSHILASALGGNVSGDITMVHWNVPRREPEEAVTSHAKVSTSGHMLVAREQSASAKFDLRDIQVDKIARLFATPRMPLNELHPAAVAEATAELAWTGSPQFSELRLDVRAIPNSHLVAGQMPVTAHLLGMYSFRAHSLQIEQAELQTPGNHWTAIGRFGANELDLEVGARSTNLHEVEPLLKANGTGDLPVHLAGEGSFQGTIEGRTALPSVSGHLKLTDFTTVLRPDSANLSEPELVKALHKNDRLALAARTASQPSAKPVSFHWDSFDGYISFTPEALAFRGAVLRSGSTRIEVAAGSTLQRGAFNDDWVFHVTSRIRDARVEDMQTLLGVNYPVTGTLNLELQMEGTRLEPHGIGKLSIHDGSAYGQPMQSLTTDLTFSGREARFTNTRAVSDSAQAEGSGSVNVSTEQFSFDVQGSGIDLLRVPALQTAKVKLTGIAGFTAKGSGTLSSPAIDGHARISNISLGGKREGNLDIDAVTHGEELDLTAVSHFVSVTFTASGRIYLRRDLSSDITMKLGNVDLQPFLVGIARGHSSIDGTLRVTGPMRYPTQLEARLEIPRYESDVEGVVLQNSGPIIASYKEGTARLQSFRLVGDGTDLNSSGTVRLVDGHDLHLRADGRLNLKLLQSFDPEIVSYGQTSIGVQVGGTLSDPALRGRITIEHAGVSYVDLPNGLTDLNGALVFNENRLQVEKLTAHTGGGDLAIGGFIAYGRNISFNLTATGKDVRIRYPEGVSANGDADLRLAGTLQNATLSGEVVINKFGLNPRFDFAYYLTRAKQVPTTPNPDSPLNNLHFDVRVVSTPELQLQTSLAKITGDVDLRLRGSALRPVVLGRISIVEGNITFNGTKYRLDRGDILFTNPTKIEPVLDLEASARVSDYDISIGLHGTTEKLNTTYRSDPPLPTADVFALLAFGRTTDQSYSAPQSNAFTESASSAVLGSALNAAVSSRVQKLFGASRIKIDPEVGGAENNPNARLTVEQQVSGDITLTYITNLTQSAQQVIQFQYNVNRNVSIVGVRDEYGVVGFEVQVRQRKR